MKNTPLTFQYNPLNPISKAKSIQIQRHLMDPDFDLTGIDPQHALDYLMGLFHFSGQVPFQEARWKAFIHQHQRLLKQSRVKFTPLSNTQKAAPSKHKTVSKPSKRPPFDPEAVECSLAEFILLLESRPVPFITEFHPRSVQAIQHHLQQKTSFSAPSMDFIRAWHDQGADWFSYWPWEPPTHPSRHQKSQAHRYSQQNVACHFRATVFADLFEQDVQQIRHFLNHSLIGHVFFEGIPASHSHCSLDAHSIPFCQSHPCLKAVQWASFLKILAVERQERLQNPSEALNSRPIALDFFSRQTALNETSGLKMIHQADYHAFSDPAHPWAQYWGMDGTPSSSQTVFKRFLQHQHALNAQSMGFHLSIFEDSTLFDHLCLIHGNSRRKIEAKHNLIKTLLIEVFETEVVFEEAFFEAFSEHAAYAPLLSQFLADHYAQKKTIIAAIFNAIPTLLGPAETPDVLKKMTESLERDRDFESVLFPLQFLGTYPLPASLMDPYLQHHVQFALDVYALLEKTGVSVFNADAMGRIITHIDSMMLDLKDDQVPVADENALYRRVDDAIEQQGGILSLFYQPDRETQWIRQLPTRPRTFFSSQQERRSLQSTIQRSSSLKSHIISKLDDLDEEALQKLQAFMDCFSSSPSLPPHGGPQRKPTFL